MCNCNNFEESLFASFYGWNELGVFGADFTREEIEMLTDAGAVPVGLGQQRLRVETAAIAILATVMLLSEGSSVDSKQR